MNIRAEDKNAIVSIYLKKSLPEKKGFFPQRRSFKWVKLNEAKAVNKEGNLTEYGKDKLMEQNIKAEFAYAGFDGNSKPSSDDVKEVLAIVKADFIKRGAW